MISNPTSQKIAAKIDEVSTKASDTASSFADKAQAEGEKLQDSAIRNAAEIADMVIEKLKSAGLNTDTLVSQAKSQASQLQKSLENEVRDRPLRTLGYAAAAGLILGLVAWR